MNKDISQNKIILVVRNYNRPEYLKKTLESLLKSDIDKCEKRYIYDDCSTDEETKLILNNEKYINVENKEFSVIYNNNNEGCKKSYLNALNYIKEHNNDCHYICTVDNDVQVKEHFISTLFNEYNKAFDIFNHTNILFTGFSPTNAHVNMIQSYDSFYTKQSFGGVNYFFHRAFLDFIYTYWDHDLDWGIVHEMVNRNYPQCCTTVSCLNHLGLYGLSSCGSCDNDSNFINDS